MKHFLYLSLLIFSFFSCKSSTKIAKPDEFEGARLTFGTGGGFSGRTTSYILLENGQVFGEGPKTRGFTEKNGVDKDLTAQMFSNYYALGIDKMEVNDPGNMFYFIKYMKDGKEKKLTWGGLDTEGKIPALVAYYKTLMSIVYKNNSVAPPPARK